MVILARALSKEEEDQPQEKKDKPKGKPRSRRRKARKPLTKEQLYKLIGREDELK